MLKGTNTRSNLTVTSSLKGLTAPHIFPQSKIMCPEGFFNCFTVQNLKEIQFTVYKTEKASIPHIEAADVCSFLEKRLKGMIIKTDSLKC